MDGEESPRMRAADCARLAEQRAAELRAAGAELHPVRGKGRALARQFWARAWMRQLAQEEQCGCCLAPGRSLLRHGGVLDLRVAPGRVEALVSGEALCEVLLRVEALDAERTAALAAACQGRVESHLALLEGRVDAALAEQLCAPETGLLPERRDWHMSCSCSDWAEPCPHEAAVLYALGCLLDEAPELLFTLRQVDPQRLLRPADPPPDTAEADWSALGALFGIELEDH
ncbi:MAG: hypothetical protein ACI4P8_05665 [Akkermansia sp.]